MAIEKHWERQGPAVFTADGTEAGLLTIESTCSFKVKQRVKIIALGEPDLSLQIKRIPTPTTIIVGPFITGKPGSSNNNLKAREDISAYTVAKVATISAVEQPKVPIPEKDIIQAVYEFEPTVAIRNFPVDCHGNGYTTENRFPVAVDGDINANVDVNVDITLPNTEHVQNITIAAANTEFKVDLPDKTKAYTLKIRDGGATARIGYNLGDTAAGPYVKIRKGVVYIVQDLDLPDNSSIYVQASKAGEILEVISLYIL